jgi:L-amino acid N-acyltransferase YncA
VVGAIDLDNTASMELHKRLGFEHCGTIKQAASSSAAGWTWLFCRRP